MKQRGAETPGVWKSKDCVKVSMNRRKEGVKNIKNISTWFMVGPNNYSLLKTAFKMISVRKDITRCDIEPPHS